MGIPALKAESITKALKELLPKLDEIKAGPHDSTKYDLLWRGYRFPPKVVVSTAVRIHYGKNLPESGFSGGRGAGQANHVLQELGFVIVPKPDSKPALPLSLFGRYGRKEIYAAAGVSYDQQKRHLNVGLSPECKDGGYFIFITLNKEELEEQEPTHDYPDELFQDQFIWVTRRGVREDDVDYLNVRAPDCRVSLFVRLNTREDFVYAGELKYDSHMPFVDVASGKPQIKFFWKLKTPLPDQLLEELTFGPSNVKRKVHPGKPKEQPSRAPSSFDEFKKAYSYVLGTAERTVIPEHQNYQVRLSQFLAKRGVAAQMEKDFVDVSFSTGGDEYIGEIKVTRNLTLSQAFRTALGQLLEYSYLLFKRPPNMVMLLDRRLDQRRVDLASGLKVAVVVWDGTKFVLLNPNSCPTSLCCLFKTAQSAASG